MGLRKRPRGVKGVPIGCLLAPKKSARDTFCYFPNSFGRGILRSPFAGSCIDRPPGGVRMASKAFTPCGGGRLHLVVLDGHVGRRMLGRCRSRLGHFPKTYAQGAGSSEINPAPPRPDPLRV